MMQCKDCLYFKRCVVLGEELDMKHDKDAEKNCRHFTAKTGEWIDVNERLPDVFERVLITDCKQISFGYCVSVDDKNRVLGDEVGNLRKWITQYPVYDVTHWMPLPEPPEHKSKGE